MDSKGELIDLGKRIFDTAYKVGKELYFDEDKHLYSKSGKYIPSATQIMQWIGLIDFGTWCPESAKDRGNRVDELIKMWRSYKSLGMSFSDLFNENDTEDVRNCMNAWRKFEDATDATIISTDMKLFGQVKCIRNGKPFDAGFCGTADIGIVALPPRLLVSKGIVPPGYKAIHADIKTSTTAATYPSPVASIQTAIYHAAFLSSVGEISSDLYRATIKLGTDGSVKYVLYSKQETEHMVSIARSLVGLMYAVRGKNFNKPVSRLALDTSWTKRLPSMDKIELADALAAIVDGMPDE